MDIKCTFGLVVGAGILGGATYYTLKHCQENPALVAAFNSCAMPAGVKLIELSKGCVCFTVQAESLSALEALWERCENGSLRSSLEDLLVTDEVKRMAEGKEVELKVNIDQDSYRNAYLELSVAEKEGRFVLFCFVIVIIVIIIIIIKPSKLFLGEKLVLNSSKTSFCVLSSSLFLFLFLSGNLYI